MTRMRVGLLRFVACAVSIVLMLALVTDIGLMVVQKVRAEALAHIAVRTALLTVERTASPEQQQRHVQRVVRAILSANAQDESAWSVSLSRSGTSWPPALQAVVATDQPVETLLIGTLAGGDARMRTGVSMEAPATPGARMIAVRPVDEAVLD